MSNNNETSAKNTYLRNSESYMENDSQSHCQVSKVTELSMHSPGYEKLDKFTQISVLKQSVASETSNIAPEYSSKGLQTDNECIEQISNKQNIMFLSPWLSLHCEQVDP